MSRSGYSDDGEHVALWRQAVDQATFGARGQRFLRKLRDAFDVMPTKRLITGYIKDVAGDVCAFGALDPDAPNYSDAEELAKYFGIARALAAEIMYVNDEFLSWQIPGETPDQRWIRMRDWVEKQISPGE